MTASIITLSLLFVDVGGGVSGSPASAGTAPPRMFALALGDSLAAGFQPGRGDSGMGYTSVLRGLVEGRVGGRLILRKLACDGETTRGMISGAGSQCDYTAGSQLDAALAFIAAHPGELAYVTIDVGANDLFGRCLRDSFLFPRSCVVRVMPRVRARLATILDALHAAAGPTVPIATMTLHEPLLGLWAMIPGAGRRLGRESLRSFRVINERFAKTAHASGAVVADVAAVFEIENFAEKSFVQGFGRLPRNVAIECRWTWFCSPQAAGDFHPNAEGYRRMAHAFARTLRPLL